MLTVRVEVLGGCVSDVTVTDENGKVLEHQEVIADYDSGDDCRDCEQYFDKTELAEESGRCSGCESAAQENS